MTHSVLKKTLIVLLSLCMLAGLFAGTAVAAPLGASASELFIQWDNLPLYGVIDALMLLCVAGFCMVAVWAKNGCSFPKGKKAVLAVILCLFIAAAPYEIVVLIVNTLIHHGVKPLFSICVSSLVQSVVVAVSAILTIVFLTRGGKKGKTAEQASTEDSES